ncbi:MAG: nucleoid-associated protein [Bacteroidetes bacterium]|nr:nucleoid-associated protein [Bacteroidota bacterium]
MFKNYKPDQIVIHFIGNKSLDEGVKISNDKLNTDDNLINLFSSYFTSSFKSTEFYNLSHQNDLKYNEVYGYISEIFDDTDELYQQSVNLAKHLYEQSIHPKVKSGEFYVAYFKDCDIDGENVDAVGLFKSENKDTFLKVQHTKDNFEINSEEGINIHKLDKGCLIFNSEREKGYLVAIVDNSGKGYEAQYWRDDFLHVSPRNDNYHQTQNLLTLCKHFVTEQLPEEVNNVSRADQVDLLNKSLNFFKENDSFNLKDFEEEVIQKPKAIKAFRDFKEQFEEKREIHISDEFDISSPAVKKQQRVFKSVIKLDKNFHIYVHGNNELIERGFDETTGMHYYKVFFKEES